MPLALSDLVSEETRDEVLSTILTIAGDVALKVTSWQPGQPIRTLLTLVSQKIADVSLLNKEAIKGGLLDYAEEGWLTLLALSLYRVVRLEATFAVGDSLTVTNASAGLINVAAGDLIVAHSVTGKTYRNVLPLALNPGDNEGIEILADEAGTGSDAASGMITELVSSIADVTVTNVDAVLGADAETDPELRQRCRDKLGSLSPNGPKEAYAYVAKTPYFPDGTPCAPVTVPITRTLEVTDPTTGIVTQYLATADGAPSGADVTIVDDALDVWATPWCVTAEAVASVELLIDVTCEVWVKGSSLTPTQIESAVGAALVAHFKTIPISGDLIYPDVLGKVRVGILELVIGKSTTGIIKVEVTLPAADVELAEGEVAVLGTVITTVTVVS